MLTPVTHAGTRRWRLTLGLMALLLLALASSQARAAGPGGFNLNHLLIKPGADRVFGVEGTEVAPAWAPYGGVWFHMLSQPLVFDVVGTPERYRVVDSLMQLHVAAGVGLGGVGEFEVILPVSVQSSGDLVRFPAVGGAAVGDLLTRLRVNLLARDGQGNGFGLNLGAAVGIPSGDPRAASGDGGVTVLPRLAVTFGFEDIVVLMANLGANFRGQTGSYGNLDFGQELVYGAGVHVQPIDAFGLGLEVLGRTQMNASFGESSVSPLELIGGFKVRALGGLHVELGGGTAIVGGYGAPRFRFFTGLQWAPYEAGTPDRDGDGIPDDEDRCPDEPEDFDGFEDADGCPDPDNDGDGIPDVDDQCPDEPEDFDGFEDADGCPDPDNDRDGIDDAFDKCPNEPEDFDGFEDEDGCPEPGPGGHEVSGGRGAAPAALRPEGRRAVRDWRDRPARGRGHADGREGS